MTIKQTKVLYLSPNGYLGGAERAMIDFCRGHHESDLVNANILFFNYGNAVEEAKKYKIETYCLKQSFKLTSLNKLILACLEIRKFVSNNKIDIVHSTMPYAHIVCFLATIGMNIRRVWYQHGPVGGILDKLASLLPHNQIYFNTEYLQRIHNHNCFMQTPYQNQFIVPYGVDANTADQEKALSIRKEHLKQSNNKLLILAGRICSWKGYHLAIKAISSLKNKYGSLNLSLLIIGSAQRDSDKNYEQYLHDLVDLYELQSLVKFIKHTSSIREYMNAADLFIHTSTTPEPFGLVVAETMLQRTLVVGSSKGGVSDILINNKTGLTFDTTKSNADQDLAKILEKLFIKNTFSTSEIEEYINNAFELVTHKHNIAQTNKVLEECYRKII